MTIAVCIKCGTMMHGTLKPCPNCQFDPELIEDKAKAMILSDHFLPKEDLEEIAERICNDQPVNYPDDAVKDYVQFFEKNPNFGKMIIGSKMIRSINRYAIIEIIVIFVLLLILVIYLSN